MAFSPRSHIALSLNCTREEKKKCKKGRDNCYQIMRGTDLNLINSTLKNSRTSEMLSCLLRCSSSYALKEQSYLVPKGPCLASHLLRFLPGCSSNNCDGALLTMQCISLLYYETLSLVRLCSIASG